MVVCVHIRDLDIRLRKQLILKEILGYNADIICLQECDKVVFDTYYQPHMEINGQQSQWLFDNGDWFPGFQCNFMQKSGITREGEAMFVRTSRFQVPLNTAPLSHEPW